MKKILMFCFSLFIVLNLMGCSDLSKGDSDSEIDVLDSKLDYVLFRNKKIYLTKNVEQFVFQFQGLKCKLNRNMEIDNITSKEHKFYQLKEENFDITCPDLSIDYPADFSGWINISDGAGGRINSVDGHFYSWSFGGGIDEGVTAYFNGKKIIVNGEDAYSEEDVIKVMGKNYRKEIEESIPFDGWFSLEYEFNDIEYEFSFNDDNELVRIYIR